jgi:hypothetical protein
MDLPVFRIAIEATAKTGLRVSSRIMIDKVMTVPRSRLGLRIGQVSDTDLLRVDRALTVFLGLAASSNPSNPGRSPDYSLETSAFTPPAPLRGRATSAPSSACRRADAARP